MTTTLVEYNGTKITFSSPKPFEEEYVNLVVIQEFSANQNWALCMQRLAKFNTI